MVMSVYKYGIRIVYVNHIIYLNSIPFMTKKIKIVDIKASKFLNMKTVGVMLIMVGFFKKIVVILLVSFNEMFPHLIMQFFC